MFRYPGNSRIGAPGCPNPNQHISNLRRTSNLMPPKGGTNAYQPRMFKVDTESGQDSLVPVNKIVWKVKLVYKSEEYTKQYSIPSDQSLSLALSIFEEDVRKMTGESLDVVKNSLVYPDWIKDALWSDLTVGQTCRVSSQMMTKVVFKAKNESE